jgi:hypothetical protein
LKLTDQDLQYIQTNGIDTIRSHAIAFINSRLVPWHFGTLAPEFPKNDGKQTPMGGI